MRVQAELVAREAGSVKWGYLVRPLFELDVRPCTVDSELPGPDHEHRLGHAWIVDPEFRRQHIHLPN